MQSEFLISALVTLLVVVDPIGLVPAFIGVTHDLAAKSRRSVALRASLIAAAILVGAALIGGWLLVTLSISLPAFRIAGGLLLFSIASEMVFGLRTQRQSRSGRTGARRACPQHRGVPARHSLDGRSWSDHGRRVARRTGRRRYVSHDARCIGVILVVCALCFVTFILAGRISGLLGVTGNIVLSRLLGVLLAALAVQFVVDGVREIWVR